jgi:hypothetical protein
MKYKKMIITLTDPHDINEGFVMLCKHLKLIPEREEKRVFIGKTRTVNHLAIIKFCEIHNLDVTLKFKENRIEVSFLPLILNIETDEDIVQREDEEQLNEAEKMLKEIEEESSIDDDFDDL